MSMCKFITHFNIWCTRCCNFSIVNRCRWTIDFVADDGVVAAVNDGDGDDDNCDAVDKFVAVVVLAIVVDNFFVDTVCMTFVMFGIVVVVVAVAATAAVAGVIVAFVIISGVIFSYRYYF